MACFLSGAKLGKLESILKPQMIKVYGNELFVVQGHQFYIYSLEGLKLKKVVGKHGEGPGEFNPDPARTIVISVLPDCIIGESRHKVVWFSRNGDFIKEVKKYPGAIQTLPLGKNYAIMKILYGEKGQSYFVVSLCNGDMKEIKELYKQRFFTYEDKLYAMPDGLYYSILGNKLFIEESPDGFVIEAFDTTGKKLYDIRKPYEKISVPAEKKKEAFEDFLQIPSMQRAIKANGKGWVNDYMKTTKVIYPDDFPAIQYIVGDGNKLYVQTYKVKDGKDEFIVMDLKGNTLKKVFLPSAKKVDFLVQMQGDKKFFSIHKDKYYYLRMVEDGEDEEWEVYVEDI